LPRDRRGAPDRRAPQAASVTRGGVVRRAEPVAGHRLLRRTDASPPRRPAGARSAARRVAVMRDLVVFGAVCLTLPWVFRQPFIGLIVFSWLAYMRPQDLCWGFARSMRLSFFVGLTMIVGYFANDAGRRPF